MRLTLPLVCTGALVAWSGLASAGRPGHPHPPRGPSCAEAGRARIELPAGLDGIDGFRIVVGAARPGAATDVTVLADGRDRTLRAFTPGTAALLLGEPLHGHQIDVALEPVLDARAPACVERVELLRAGLVVGTAEIR